MQETMLSGTDLAKRTKKPSTFLRYIHNFRGFAILFIVATHVIPLLEWNSAGISKAVQILIGNGTVYFVFIAGFLFQFLSAKYEYVSYLTKKLQYVLIPYCLISIPAIALCLAGKIYDSPAWFDERFADWSVPGKVLMYLLTGAHLPPFWFIPMIAIFYLISPLLLWVDRHPKTYWILPALLLMTVMIPRPVQADSALQSFAHFLSIYVAGMLCSHVGEKLFPFVQKRYWVFVFSLIALTVLEFVVEPRLTSINSISKLIVSVLVIDALRRTESKLPKSFHNTMGFLAEMSFGIYFLHDYFIIAYAGLANNLRLSALFRQANLFSFSVIFLLGLGASIACILFLQRCLGKKSRFVVGS